VFARARARARRPAFSSPRHGNVWERRTAAGVASEFEGVGSPGTPPVQRHARWWVRLLKGAGWLAVSDFKCLCALTYILVRTGVVKETLQERSCNWSNSARSQHTRGRRHERNKCENGQRTHKKLTRRQAARGSKPKHRRCSPPPCGKPPCSTGTEGLGPAATSARRGGGWPPPPRTHARPRGRAGPGPAATAMRRGGRHGPPRCTHPRPTGMEGRKPAAIAACQRCR
jgi:hypothetical protein